MIYVLALFLLYIYSRMNMIGISLRICGALPANNARTQVSQNVFIIYILALYDVHYIYSRVITIKLHIFFYCYDHTTYIPALFNYIFEILYIYCRVVMIGLHTI